MNKLPILIDCDGVLADFTKGCLQLAADKANIFASEADVTQWNTAVAIGWPALDYEVTRAINEREFCFRLQAYPEALPWLRAVEREFGTERVFICTSPWNAAWLSQRAAWLEQRGVPMKRQIQCSAKHLIPGHLIDDASHNVAGRPSAFMLSRPWNKNYAPLCPPRGDYAAAMAWLREVA